MTDKNQTDDNKPTFADLGLRDEILRALKDVGYTHPTPIQAQAIPQVLRMRDVIGVAQTGTGKTAGFTLPLIEILTGGRARARMPRSLILSPTRELAAQIDENFQEYGKYCPLNTALLVGGESVVEQKKILNKGVDVLIATPGRLLDLFERGLILMSDIKILVIDEADRMLDMGFIPDIEKIIGFLPPMRQTLMFTATMQGDIRKLAKKFLDNPKEIAVSSPSSTAKTVTQYLFETTKRNKNNDLEKIIKNEDVNSALVFCNRKRDIQSLVSFLRTQGHKVAEMHGDMTQTSRYESLEKFKDGKINMIICSDVVARGIDIDDVSHVFNYDVPHNAEDYVHRIGRTGRAGKSGCAITLKTPDEDKSLAAVEKLIDQSIQKYDKLSGQKQSSSSKPQPSNKNQDHKKNTKPENKKTNKAASKTTSSAMPSKPITQSSSHKNKHADNNGKNDQHNDNTVGFGDDIPAFLR